MKLQVQATDREENKQIALGTSKLNYLDPRISVAWYLCERVESSPNISSKITMSNESTRPLLNRPAFSQWVGARGAYLPC